MPRSLPVPVVVVCALYAVYGAVVITLFATDRPVLPAQVNTIVAAGAVICAIVAARRPAPPCNCAAEFDALREQVRELRGQVSQPVYMVPAPRQSEEPREGLGPQAIDALRRMDRRLGGDE